MRTWRPVVVLAALAMAGAASATAAQESYPGENLVIDYVKILGPAPWPPTVGGQAPISCDMPEIQDQHPRCRAWKRDYDAYQVRLRTLLAEEAAKRGD